MTFIDVPSVPGVPALNSYAPNNISLLLSDAVTAAAQIFGTWGVYLDGEPIILPASLGNGTPIAGEISAALSVLGSLATLVNAAVPGGLSLPNGVQPSVASTVEFDYAQDWRLPTYPVEQGAFQNYDKVSLPFDVRLRLAAGGTALARQAFLNTVRAMGDSLALFDVVTPELTYTSCNVNHIDWRRTAERGVELIVVEVWFQQINVSASASFQNTQSPVNVSPQAQGAVQPQTPNQYVSQNFGSWN